MAGIPSIANINRFNESISGSSLGLSLDLQFATDKSLTARKGPTPVFTRASVGSYHGLNINVVAPAGSFEMSSNANTIGGKPVWTAISDSAVTFTYESGRWVFAYLDGDDYVFLYAALGNEFRPDQANWTGESNISVSTSSNFSIQYAATNEPRFDHSTTAPNACLGLLIEESRTNLVFPSATLTTQTRTVTATAHTLSFYGTGTVVLAGAHIATVTGTGAYPTRTTLTFTPSAGSLILTVTGTVRFAQLEAGAFVTSYIPAEISSLVRSADVCSITGANFSASGFYNQAEGTIIGQGIVDTVGIGILFPSFANFNDGTANNRVILGSTNSGGSAVRPLIVVAGATSFNNGTGSTSAGQFRKVGMVYKQNDFIAAHNGNLGTADNTGNTPTAIDRVSFDAPFFVGTISSIRYYRKRISNAKLQSLTA
jgi:hypothetical protein